MINRDRPPLSPEIQEEIETEQHRLHEFYWTLLRTFAVDTLLLSLSSDIPPPRTPVKLARVLGEYSCALFEVERKVYPKKDPLLVEWLSCLAERIEEHIMTTISGYERRLSGSRISYHATEEQMRTAISMALEGHLKARSCNSRASTKLSESARSNRLSATITSPSAVRRMEAYLRKNGIGQTEFAIQAQTTDRTLRTFRKTGKVRQDIFASIARSMGMRKDELLKD